jgi:hypothetical protein
LLKVTTEAENLLFLTENPMEKNWIVKVVVDDECTGVVGPFTEEEAEAWSVKQCERAEQSKAPAQRPVTFCIMELIGPY